MRKFASEVCFHKGKCFIVGFFLFYGEVLQAATMKLSVWGNARKLLNHRCVFVGHIVAATIAFCPMKRSLFKE